MTTMTKDRAREYETIYILRPDIDADAAEKVAGRVTEVIDKMRGRLLAVDSWGRRKLEYSIAKQNKGIYILVRYLGYSDMVAELERNLRMMDTVIKHQTVLIEKDIDPGTRTVNPDQIKFARIEPEVEEPVPDESKITYRDADDYVSGKPTIVGDAQDDEESPATEEAEA
jgi:small subunit ribosomal protein S6